MNRKKKLWESVKGKREWWWWGGNGGKKRKYKNYIKRNWEDEKGMQRKSKRKKGNRINIDEKVLSGL